MVLSEVIYPEDKREFLEFPARLYKNDPNYVRPLDEDVEQVFDASRNRYYKAENCKRWLLKDNHGRTIGRIAAFINHETAYTYEQPTGGIGFFECVDNRDAAFLLFDRASEWLKEQGMEAVDGPVNLGNRERFWGLLVDGFTPPCYCCNYHQKYYRIFFEDYGFNVFFRQFTYIREVKAPLRQAYHQVAERIASNPAYSFKNIDLNDINVYIEDFRNIYNKAWVNHEGIEQMSFEAACNVIKPMRAVIDPNIAWFAYYNDEPIGFFLCIPELNELFIKGASGKLNLRTKLRLLWNKYLQTCHTMYGLVFGVVPEHQKRGVEIAMIVHAKRQLEQSTAYRQIQMNWIGDFNPKMMHVAEQIGARIYKTHHTYRLLFKQDVKFERHPEI